MTIRGESWTKEKSAALTTKRFGGAIGECSLLPLACLSFIIAFVWIYGRVMPSGSWVRSGLAFGFFGWAIGQVPLWLLWYAEQPWPDSLVVKQTRVVFPGRRPREVLDERSTACRAPAHIAIFEAVSVIRRGVAVRGTRAFISYSNLDRTVADAAVAVLESRGVRCWIAPRDVTPGLDWSEEIVEAIEHSSVMVLKASAHANSSPQIKREVERGVNHGIPIIPFRIEDVPLSKALEYFISSPHWLDAMTPPLEEHLQYLADTTQLLIDRRAGKSGATGQMRKRTERRRQWTGASRPCNRPPRRTAATARRPVHDQREHRPRRHPTTEGLQAARGLLSGPGCAQCPAGPGRRGDPDRPDQPGHHRGPLALRL